MLQECQATGGRCRPPRRERQVEKGGNGGRGSASQGGIRHSCAQQMLHGDIASLNSLRPAAKKEETALFARRAHTAVIT